MAIPAFFHAHIPAAGGSVTLEAQEARHAAGARRLRVGDSIRLINGTGLIADARIETVSREVLSAVVTARENVPAPVPKIHVVSALPRGERQRYMIDSLAQLGVASLIPLNCERSDPKSQAMNPDRLQRVVIEACKQSQNAHFMSVEPPETPAAAVRRFVNAGVTCLLADPAGQLARNVRIFQVPEAALFIGPEGGLTPRERSDLLQAGATALSLGRQILRIETAAVALVAIVMAGNYGVQC